MSNYVNREDIDRLISMVNEIDIALKKQGVNNISELVSMYYDQSDIDISLNAIDETVEEANNLIDSAKKDLNDFKREAQTALRNLTSDKVNVTDFEVYQGEMDTALDGKSDVGHIHPISDVTSLQTTLDGKAPKNHQHEASDVLYTIKDDLLWGLINTTIDKNLNGETLTGIYSLVNTEFNLSTAQSTEHTNDKYYIVYANTTTDVTTAISTGIDVSADIEDEYIKEMLDTKRNNSDVISASEVDVISNWGGNRHQQAQTVFESIWRAINSGIGGNGSRVFVAEAEWNSTNSVFELSSDNIPTADWQKGDMLIIPLFTNMSEPKNFVENNKSTNKFIINNTKHTIVNPYYGDNNKLFNNPLKLRTYMETVIILICTEFLEANEEYDGLGVWRLIYNSNYDGTNNDFDIIDNFNNPITATNMNVASAYGVKKINDKLATYTDDSDWVNLDFDGITDFTYYNNTTHNPEARRIGKQVYVRGAIKSNGDLTSTNAGLVMARLPDGFAPSKNIYTVQQGANAFRYMLIITTSGELRVARYTNNTATNGTISANSWLGIYCSFAID